jgi:hypothetical protein
MTDYKPLYFTLTLLLIIGVVMPLIISDFVDVSEVETDSILDPLITLVNEGVGIFGFNLDIFGFLGDTLQDSLVDYLTIFALIPEIILIPLIIIMIIGIVYTIVKMLPTT